MLKECSASKSQTATPSLQNKINFISFLIDYVMKVLSEFAIVKVKNQKIWNH